MQLHHRQRVSMWRTVGSRQSHSLRRRVKVSEMWTDWGVDKRPEVEGYQPIGLSGPTVWSIVDHP